MITTPQDLPISTQRFQPYIRQLNPYDLQKRYYKHIHHLTLEPNNRSFLKRTPMPKTLHTLNIVSQCPDQILPLVKKLVKPYRKYLRDIQGVANHPEIQKLLPFLITMRVNLTQEAFRMLAFHSGAKKLRFNIARERFRRMSGEELLIKFRIPLSRNLAKMKDLTTISMIITGREVQAANLMLEIIEKNVNFVTLKVFSLNFRFDPLLPDFRKLQEQKTGISKAHERLTHLSTCHLAWYSFFVSCGNLANLSVLWLQLSSTEISWDSKDLLQFHRLAKLQKFTLDVTSHSLPFEMDFFGNLTFSSSLEDLSLTLEGFTLNENHAPYSLFYERLQEAKRVKALNLKINSKSAAQFSCLFIKCFDVLEVLELTNLPVSSLGSRKGDTEAKPLNFQAFWEAVSSSKETLRSISVNVNGIIFPEEITVLETEFPRLQKIHLGETVSSMTGLGTFCQNICSLRDVTLKGVKLTDEEKLETFLDEVKEIPEKRHFELYLDVEKIKQELLIDCLKKYIKEAKVKGRLGMYFEKVKAEDAEEFGEILKLVAEKGCFEQFQVKRLFWVEKTNILVGRWLYLDPN